MRFYTNSKMSIAIAGIITLALFACNKENQPDTAIVKSTATPTKKVNWKSIAKLPPISMTGSDTEPCAEPAYDCTQLGEVIVRPKIDEMISVSLDGSSTTVGDFFSDPSNDVLIDDLDGTTVAQLRSGTTYMALNYDGADVVNFYFGSTYPVTSSNYDFVLQWKHD